MNLFIKSMLCLSAFAPMLASAQVNVKLHKDVEALVVNGEALPITITGHSEFNLEDGDNQLVVRLSKLVSTGSDFDKFKSDPLVITFNASDTDITINPSRDIVAERQIKDFKENPSFSIVASNGSSIQAEQAVLPAGPGFMRDYEKETAKFNSKRGIQVASIIAPVSTSVAVESVSVSESPVAVRPAIKSVKNVEMSSDNSMILMQADFLRMSAEEQQKFLQWAVKNVRS